MVVAVRAQEPFAAEASQLSHPDCGLVIGMGEQLEAGDAQFLDAPPRDESHGPCHHPAPAGVSAE
jgi:hypothetical protein